MIKIKMRKKEALLKDKNRGQKHALKMSDFKDLIITDISDKNLSKDIDKIVYNTKRNIL